MQGHVGIEFAYWTHTQKTLFFVFWVSCCCVNVLNRKRNVNNAIIGGVCNDRGCLLKCVRGCAYERDRQTANRQAERERERFCFDDTKLSSLSSFHPHRVAHTEQFPERNDNKCKHSVPAPWRRWRHKTGASDVTGHIPSAEFHGFSDFSPVNFWRIKNSDARRSWILDSSRSGSGSRSRSWIWIQERNLKIGLMCFELLIFFVNFLNSRLSPSKPETFARRSLSLQDPSPPTHILDLWFAEVAS